MPRVTVFIDGSNLYHGAERAQLNPDIVKMAHKLADGDDRTLVRAYYYVAAVSAEGNEERAKSQQRFLDQLRRADYFEVRLGRLQHQGANRYKEKGVDTKLVVDMVYMAARNLYDVGVLVSGDADHVCAVEAVKDLGKHVENAYFGNQRSQHLVTACDRFVKLDREYLADCSRPERAPLEAVVANATAA